MARPLRLHVPGAVYHVMSRGNNKQFIFTDDVDRRRYLEILSEVLPRFGIRCFSYCLMSDHFHLLLGVGALPLSRLMQQLNSRYCQWFNRRHGRVGHVLQGRFTSRIVADDEYVLRAFRYVARNPVAAGMVARPSAWAWSSVPATVGLVPVPDFLDLTLISLALDAKTPQQLHNRFAAFVEDQGEDELNGTLIIASPAFAARVEPILALYRMTIDYSYAERFATRPPLLEALRAGEELESCETAVARAFQQYAYTLREIGEALRRHPSTIWSWVQRVRSGHRLLSVPVSHLLPA